MKEKFTSPTLSKWIVESGQNEALSEFPQNRFSSPDPGLRVLKAAPSRKVMVEEKINSSADLNSIEVANMASTLSELRNSMIAFDGCSLKNTAINIVFGDGDEKSDVMVILNIILYSPLLTIIEERKEYILSHLAEASEKLAQAKELTTQYEQDLETARKSAQLEIANSQNIHKEILDIELDISQKYIDSLLDTISNDLLDKKKTALDSLDSIVQSLCTEVETKLSI